MPKKKKKKPRLYDFVNVNPGVSPVQKLKGDPWALRFRIVVL